MRADHQVRYHMLQEANTMEYRKLINDPKGLDIHHVGDKIGSVVSILVNYALLTVVLHLNR